MCAFASVTRKNVAGEEREKEKEREIYLSDALNILSSYTKIYNLKELNEIKTKRLIKKFIIIVHARDGERERGNRDMKRGICF